MRAMALSGEPGEKVAGWAEARPHKIALARKVAEFTRLRNGKRHLAEHASLVASGTDGRAEPQGLPPALDTGWRAVKNKLRARLSNCNRRSKSLEWSRPL